ncbi:MAG: hypothetical protein D6813_10830, partial [Calditrichaeota bacterium]
MPATVKIIKPSQFLILFIWISLHNSSFSAPWVSLTSNYLQALSLAGQQDYQSAITILQRELAKDSTFVPVYYRIAEFFIYQNKIHEGEKYFANLIKKQPDNPYNYLGLAYWTSLKDDWSMTFNNCTAAIKKGLLNRQIIELLAQAAVKSGQTRLTSLHRVIRQKSKNFNNLLTTLINLHLKKFATVNKYFKRFKTNKTERWYLLYLEGKINQQKQKFKTAISSYIKAFNLNNIIDPFTKIELYSLLGECYYKTNKADSARYFLTLASDLASQYGALNLNLKAISILVRIDRETGDYVNLKHTVQKGIEIAQKFELARSYLIRFYFDYGQAIYSLGDFEHALTIFSDISKKFSLSHPLDTKIKYLLGLCYYKLHEYNKAIESLDKAMMEASRFNIKNLLPDIYWQLAEIYEILDNKKEAKRFYEKVLRYAQNIQNYPLIEKCYLKLARLYINFNNDNAHYYLTLADAFAKATMQPYYTANHRWLEGVLNLHNQKFEQAEIYLKDALNLGKQTLSLMSIICGRSGLSQLYDYINHPDLAQIHADSATYLIKNYYNIIKQDLA